MSALMKRTVIALAIALLAAVIPAEATTATTTVPLNAAQYTDLGSGPTLLGANAGEVIYQVSDSQLVILNAIEREAETSAAVERLRADRERAEAEVERPAEAVTRAQAQVQAAASTVVRCELERLVRASAEATERAVAALSQLIACADGAARGNLSFDPSAPGVLASNEIAAARQGLVARAQRHTAGAAFRLWRAALETDADAPLPPVAP